MRVTEGQLVSLPEICAPREALLRLFDRYANKPYIYLHASAGYGKTISTLLWLKKTGNPFAWRTLDQYDNTISLFYRSLCRSLLEVAPQVDAAAQFLASPSFATAPVETAMEFLSMLTWREEKFTLVLDDLHLITSEEILKSLPFVLKRLPSSVNVLLLSRIALPKIMDALTENGKTAFIGSRELAFTPEEIRSHYAGYGQFITIEEAKDIHAFTDGWVILLNLMAINNRHAFDDEKQKRSFDDFFEQNIWNGFDEATRIFLMNTSVVDSFTLQLCEMLTEIPNCEEILSHLMHGNINITRLGNEYHYHHLFLNFLRDRLETSGIDRIKLYSQAALYYLETNNFLRAAVFGLLGNNEKIGMRIIHMFYSIKSPTLEQCLEQSRAYEMEKLPKQKLDKSPILYMPNMLAAYFRGNMEMTQGLFDRFYASLPVFVKIKHPITDICFTHLIFDCRVKLSELPTFIDSLGVNQDRKASGQAAIFTMQMPLAHRSVRDFYEFSDERVKENLRGLFSCFLPDDCACFYHSVTAGLLMEQNKLDNALAEALSAYEKMTEDTDREIYFAISVALAEVYFLRSEKEQGQSKLSQLRKQIEQHKAQHLLKNLTAYEERKKIEDGNRKTAEDWLENYFVNDSSVSELHKIYQTFTTVRAYIALAKTDRALTVLEQLKELGRAYDRPLDTAEADVLMSVIYWHQGRKKDAQERLQDLLISLYPYRFIRIVANEGRAVLPIITSIMKMMDKDSETDRDFYQYVKEIHIAAYERSRQLKGLTFGVKPKTTKLSKQQTLVLELLSKGHKNAQIVELTGLSLNTIRYHTKLAYQKLEVTNAMDAIIKAKELGILK